MSPLFREEKARRVESSLHFPQVRNEVTPRYTIPESLFPLLVLLHKRSSVSLFNRFTVCLSSIKTKKSDPAPGLCMRDRFFHS